MNIFEKFGFGKEDPEKLRKRKAEIEEEMAKIEATTRGNDKDFKRVERLSKELEEIDKKLEGKT